MDGVIKGADRKVLERLFGHQLDARVAARIGEVAKSAVFMDKRRAGDAVTALLLNIVHEGIGGGVAAGWTAGAIEGGWGISIYRLAETRRAA